ncbi:TonB-dependent receptor [uncultured Bacteroides sp.]|uniref:SusC/RagA family TonB-linked outer membrane protein n=1 Tax=uncultured Bacteroides sp. TaxID=162156 RepID=UPI002603E741|nr:TonB-dependent receptor [uncultured Bacteroides sp.]
MEKIFLAIEEKSNCSFFYPSNLDLKQKASISVKSVELTAELLNSVFKDTGLTFSMDGKQIYVAKRTEKQTKVFTKDKDAKIEVRGRVIDENGEPVIGATVMVKGSSSGTITDFDGNYVINVSSNKDVLQFSFLGYSNKEEVVGNRRFVSLVMSEDVEQLDEVVVVGYGTQKKESVVGAISQVGSEDLVNSGTPNITNAITGKLSGVMTMQTSGQPGKNDAEIIIRGISSWNGSKPLVLVDGIERDFTDLDPNEIETISVLKDASATAVFGARGANGVIIVTTKEGKIGNPKFKISFNHGISWATKLPKHVDAGTVLNAYNEQLMNSEKYEQLVSQSTIQKYVNPSSPLEAIMYPDVDWLDELTNNFANVTNANANLSGGTEFVNYFSSIGFMRESSLFTAYQGNNKYHDANFDYRRFNYRTNLDFKLTKSTKLQLKVGGDISINKSPGSSPWRSVFSTSSVNYPAYYPAWMLEEFPDLYYPDAHGIRLVSPDMAPFPVKNQNPYSILHLGNFNQTNSMKLFTDLVLNQKLDFITKGLSLQAKVAFNTYYTHTSLTSSYNQKFWTFYPERIGTDQNPWKMQGEGDFYYHEVENPNLGVGGLGSFNKALHYEFSLRYDRSFGKHNVTGLALMNRDINHIGAGYPYLYESWVGRATYDYGKRYLFEFNVGYTGSEKFAPSNRFGLFPSFAIGWVISQEKFFKKAFPWINKFKVRYSDGLVGSDASANRWLYISEYSKNGSNITEDKIPNLHAQWEEARKQDIGIEMSFLNNELTLGLDLYQEKRDKMLLSPRYNIFVGTSFKDLNIGSMKKHGMEIEVGYRKHTTYGLDYNIQAMAGFTENRILSKDDLPYAPEYQKIAGKAYGGRNSGQITIDGNFFNSIDESHIYPSTSISKYMATTGGYKYIDYNSDGVIDNLDVFSIKGSNYAPCSFSLTGGLKYKNFSMSMVWYGNIGKYVLYNSAFFKEFFSTEVVMHENQVDYWRPDNHDATHHGMGAASLSFAGGDDYDGFELGIQGFSWVRANYIKLKEIRLAYNVKSKFLKKVLGMNNFNVFVDGTNLLMFTELPMGDPESKLYKEGTYPQMASARIGFNMDF